ncbi:hypothetical protein SAMN02745121_03056 [Nannocystis exedens]|uniref:CVNH domain-containing protein n=2 Tax=Nannocystis exedens TaxID=54 RepID=A0A1I1XT06_9BACT|nr:hypothetical protein NAEX_06305 [Nannocystis exedens]SFE10456.1 hypothetical protein SAMN02745121_03056 [Nannocystis exedens]
MRTVLIALLMLGCRSHPRVAPASAATMAEPASAPRTADELCRADGFDFAYTHPDLAAERVVTCGTGQGTPCDRARTQYCEGRKLLLCDRGKMVAVDCRMACQYLGFTPLDLHDDGTCVERDGQPTCVCCDVGEPGCTTEPGPLRRGTVPLSQPPAPK